LGTGGGPPPPIPYLLEEEQQDETNTYQHTDSRPEHPDAKGRDEERGNDGDDRI